MLLALEKAEKNMHATSIRESRENYAVCMLLALEKAERNMHATSIRESRENYACY